jgi:PAS domain S-box-containing protein
MIYVDCDGAIRVWNQAAEALFGYSADEVLGKSPDVIILSASVVRTGKVRAKP